MSEPTKAAMNAGQKLWPVAATLSATEISEFIDRETGLPELVAACKKALDYRNAAYVPNMLFQRIEDALRTAGEL